MALSSSGLENLVLSFLKSTATDKQAAATALVDAYSSYAAAGQFGANTITIDGARKSALSSTLAAALIPSPDPALFLAALASGLATFWTGVPVVGAQTGATNGCPGAASLPAALATALAIPNTREVAAATLAAALHTATLTVTATVSPPGGTVLPIS